MNLGIGQHQVAHFFNGRDTSCKDVLMVSNKGAHQYKAMQNRANEIIIIGEIFTLQNQYLAP